MGVLVLLAVMVLVASDGMEWGMSLGDWRRTMAVMTVYAMGVVDGEDRGEWSREDVSLCEWAEWAECTKSGAERERSCLWAPCCLSVDSQ